MPSAKHKFRSVNIKRHAKEPYWLCVKALSLQLCYGKCWTAQSSVDQICSSHIWACTTSVYKIKRPFTLALKKYKYNLLKLSQNDSIRDYCRKPRFFEAYVTLNLFKGGNGWDSLKKLADLIQKHKITRHIQSQIHVYKYLLWPTLERKDDF